MLEAQQVKPDPDEQMKEEAEVEEAMELDADETQGKKEAEVEIERSLGYWKKRSTGERLGGKEGRVSFIVIG